MKLWIVVVSKHYYKSIGEIILLKYKSRERGFFEYTRAKLQTNGKELEMSSCCLKREKIVMITEYDEDNETNLDIKPALTRGEKK